MKVGKKKLEKLANEVLPKLSFSMSRGENMPELVDDDIPAFDRMEIAEILLDYGKLLDWRKSVFRLLVDVRKCLKSAEIQQKTDCDKCDIYWKRQNCVGCGTAVEKKDLALVYARVDSEIEGLGNLVDDGSEQEDE